VFERVSVYPLDHLYPGPVGQDLLFQSLLTPPGRLQALLTGHRAHLRGHDHVVLQPGQSLRWRRRREEEEEEEEAEEEGVAQEEQVGCFVVEE